jgi:hypothetical protein
MSAAKGGARGALAAKRWEEEKPQMPAPRLVADRAMVRVSRGLGFILQRRGMGDSNAEVLAAR